MRIATESYQDFFHYSAAEIIDWLMQGDPSIRWQVMRDLLEDDEESIEQEKALVAEIGWGLRYLSYQEP